MDRNAAGVASVNARHLPSGAETCGPRRKQCARGRRGVGLSPTVDLTLTPLDLARADDLRHTATHTDTDHDLRRHDSRHCDLPAYPLPLGEAFEMTAGTCPTSPLRGRIQPWTART